MDPSIPPSQPRRSNRLLGLQPPSLTEFDPFGNDVLIPLPMLGTKNDPPTNFTDTINQHDDHSSNLLSYADSSPTAHPNSESSPSLSFEPYHTPQPTHHNNNLTIMTQNVSQLHSQVSLLTERLESLLYPPSPDRSIITPFNIPNQIPPQHDFSHESTHEPTQAYHSTTSSSRHTRPDPPEDSPLQLAVHSHVPTTIPILAHATITDPYLKSTTFQDNLLASNCPPTPPSKMSPPVVQIIPPLDHPPTTNTSPTILPHPAPTYIYPKDIKLSLTSFKQGHNYLKWKRLCIIEISCNSKYHDIVIDIDGDLEFNPDMCSNSSRALFLATTKALGSLVDNYVSSSDIQRASGYTLWDTLDQSEIHKDSTLVQRQSLIRNFATITKHRNETIEQYTTRFETKLDELNIKNLTIPSEPELVCQYLSSLKMNHIFNDTLRKFDDQTWYQTKSWIQIMIWCKNEIAVYHTINGTTNDTNQTRLNRNDNPGNNHDTPRDTSGRNSNRTPNQPNGRNNNRNQPNAQDPPRPRPSPRPPNNTPNANNDSPSTYPRNNTTGSYNDRNANPPPQYNQPQSSPFQDELTADIQRSSNPEAIFRFLHNNHSAVCPLHNDSPHPLLSCYLLGRICRECGVMPALMEVKRSVGLLPPRDQGGSNTSTYQRYPNNNRPPVPPVPSPNTPNPPPSQPQNPYRGPTQPTYVPYNRLPLTHTPAPAARRALQETPPPAHDIPDQAYYAEDVNDFETDTHSIIEVDNNINNDLNVYPTISPPICRKLVSFAPDTRFPQSGHILSTTQYSPHDLPFPASLDSLYRFVLDSGATDHMSPFPDMFESITYYDQLSSDSPVVIMGDERTKVPILGHGFININIHNKRIRAHALYIPDMGNTCLYSIHQHMRYTGCIFHAEAQNTTLSFPDFIIKPRVAQEIDVLGRLPEPHQPVAFDESSAAPISTLSKSSSMICKITDKRYTNLSLISSSAASYIPADKYSNFSEIVQIQRLVPHATIPSTATPTSRGHDVTSTDTVTLLPRQTHHVPTGIAAALPPTMSIRITDHHSLSVLGVTVRASIVDSSYRGELRVDLHNTTDLPIVIRTGNKIAQFIFERATVPCFRITNRLPHSLRNKGGFGSPEKTGITRVKTFRISPDELLIVNHKNYVQPRIRKVNTRSSQTLDTSHSTIAPSPSAANTSDTAHTTTIIHHLNDDATIPVDSALKQKVPHIDPSHHEPSPSTLQTSPPTLSPVDTVNHALPKHVTMSRDVLRKSIGFLSTKPLLKHLKFIGDTSLKIPPYSDNPTLDPGMTASIKSTRRNTTPSTLPPNYSDVWHLDIGFGPCTAIGGIRYTLLAVDKSSRYKLVYGLKNLTTSLHSAIAQFLIDCGRTPKLIRTDFDPKLIAGETRKILTDNQVKIEAAPPHRQHQNGLVERAWQTIVTMTRNWLTSARLPAKYWYFGVKRACEVLNMMPIKRHDTITTPHEVVHNSKVNYRALFPMFTTAYIKQVRDEGTGSKWKSRALKCICVGTCPSSDALLFYHPPSKQTLSCADGYRFDSFSPSGPQFNEPYESNFIFNTKSSLENIHSPLTHEANATKYYQVPDTDEYIAVTILSIPVNDETDHYVIQHKDSGDIHEVLASELRDDNPNATPTDVPNPHLPVPHMPWIRDKAKVTLYLPHIMTKPKQGYLDFNDSNWRFLPGRKGTQRPIDLRYLEEKGESLVHNKKLFQGWKSQAITLTARRVRVTSNFIAHHVINRKVSAANLNLLEAPSLLKHDQLHPDDKATWDEAYRQEFQGLVDIDTWETISEDEYQQTKHLYKGTMPTMAIALIKYDGEGKPIRAKYRIVALGNLDPNTWSKSDCFAPVLSQFELRLLISIATQKKCIPKTGDVAQAFCQSTLPPGENYVCRPPAGCPITKNSVYWKLKKTLYGLKRSPRHFYDLAKKTLLDIGFTVHPTSPCLFIGHLVDGHPPIYLGLYVDDFIYFSESRTVEIQFEQEFGAKLDTDFNGPIQWFLGIKFQTQQDRDNNVSILMSQTAFIDTLLQMCDLDHPHVTEPRTPYRVGYPVDSIPITPLSDANEQAKLKHRMQQLIGCLTWLSMSTRPDIATITNILAKYTSNPSKGHLESVKRVVRYLKGTREHGICFTTKPNDVLESFVKFPLNPSTVTSLTDANWGPQDQSKPRPNETRQLEPFKTRSLSGFLIWLGGPIHWISKRQTITARSSAESEIYATDECTKCLLHLAQLLQGLHLQDQYMPTPSLVYNDNSACIQWASNMTTKGLRHVQIRENAVRESVISGFIKVKHVKGKVNLSDLFTKEDRDTGHFLTIRDFIITDRIPSCNSHPVDGGGCQVGTRQDGLRVTAANQISQDNQPN